MRKKIAFISHYWSNEAITGGEQRQKAAVDRLSKICDVEIFSCSWGTESQFNYMNIPVTKIGISKKSINKLSLFPNAFGPDYFGLASSILLFEDQKFRKKIIDKLADFEYLYFSHEHLIWISKLLGTKKIIVDLHNNESHLRKEILNINHSTFLIPPELQIKIFDHNRKLTSDFANLILCSNPEDLQSTEKKSLHIPNGFTPKFSIQELEFKLNNTKERKFCFVGSSHEPNLEAAAKIKSIAEKMPNATFEILGKASTHIESENLSNLAIMREASDADVRRMYLNCSIFLNLVSKGSGTSIKTIEAFGHGLAQIGFEHSMRGITDEIFRKSSLLLSNQLSPEDLIHLLDNFEIPKKSDLLDIAIYAREKFDWKNVYRDLTESVILGI